MRAPTTPRMPFGKHKDIPLDNEDIPDHYIAWLRNEPPFRLFSWLAEAIEDEYQRRNLDSQPQQRRELVIELQIPVSLRQLAQEVFTLGFKQAARIVHPDRTGGPGHTMQELNRLRHDIVQQLKTEADQ